MSVVEAVTAFLGGLGEVGASPMAATALVLARELDNPSNSATSKSMCARALSDALDRLRELAPRVEREDDIERYRRRRDERLSRQSEAGSSSSS